MNKYIYIFSTLLVYSLIQGAEKIKSVTLYSSQQPDTQGITIDRENLPASFFTTAYNTMTKGGTSNDTFLVDCPSQLLPVLKLILKHEKLYEELWGPNRLPSMTLAIALKENPILNFAGKISNNIITLLMVCDFIIPESNALDELVCCLTEIIYDIKLTENNYWYIKDTSIRTEQQKYLTLQLLQLPTHLLGYVVKWLFIKYGIRFQGIDPKISDTTILDAYQNHDTEKLYSFKLSNNQLIQARQRIASTAKSYFTIQEEEGNTFSISKTPLTVHDFKDDLLDKPTFLFVTNLNLSNNKLTSVLNIGMFKKLLTLNLCDNKIKSIPAQWIHECTELTAIYLDYNNISLIPDDFLETNICITQISIKNNSVNAIPDSFLRGCVQLETLDLSFNKIKCIPDSFLKSCTQIKDVDLKENNIESLPLSLLKKARYLKTVYLDENPLKDIYQLLNVKEDVFNKIQNIQRLLKEAAEQKSSNLLQNNNNKVASNESDDEDRPRKKQKTCK
ncbi:hypothetical protein J120_00460 [candidate division TM6 bacterium JCVI TM6SC1]|uniref:Uncharacterized protein n=1 Tax=candidate division TM6 bacterium JCVI TM6SC1 TaxID=1306947 RepID=A0A0D2GPW9_9BACT|nr:hypothetical protein J120_00460 [candidate division TM6 bacterium JCVI TM6SC1]